MNLDEIYSAYLSSSEVSTDSRKINKDCIFFALRGDNFNGNKYAKSALENGAAYAVIDENPDNLSSDHVFIVENVLKTLQQLSNFHRRKLSIPIIGITGSNGKTTTKELLAAVLNTKYPTYFTKGNLNNHIGVPLSLLSINEKHEIALIEMGANHQQEIEFLCSLVEPNYGLITNIGKAHLEGFGGVEGIIKGKGELFDYIQKSKGTIFLNVDSEVLKKMAKSRELSVITYGKHLQANLEGSLESSNPFISFVWNWSFDGITVKSDIPTTSQLFGSYNYDNLLAAVCVGNYFNIDEESINEALSGYQSEMNRSQILEKRYNTIYLDAYNANPTSMKAALESFAQLRPDKQKLLILGDMFELGEASFNEHHEILNILNNLNLTNAYLVGKHFYEHKNNFSLFQFFEDRENLIQSRKIETWQNFAILIKGSRGVALEKLLDFLP